MTNDQNDYDDYDDYEDYDDEEAYQAEEHYKVHQERWEQMNRDARDNPEWWRENELQNNEELLAELEAYALVLSLLQRMPKKPWLTLNREKEGRERAREERYDDYRDEGHDDRIQKLEDTAQLARNQIAYLKGEYERHTEPMRNYDDENDGGNEYVPEDAQEESDGEEDMDITEDDSDG